MSFAPEPPYRHGSLPKAGVLLVNLGTPEAATPAAVRRYLKEFLSDRRVVEIPRALWWLILNGIILNVRPRASARKYAAIWTDKGSPLRTHTERQARLLAGFLGERVAAPLEVAWAMRYGEPSIGDALRRLKAGGCDRIVVLPLYPQYAASTTASVFDCVANYVEQTRNVPALRLVRSFHDHPGYIAALASSVGQHWDRYGRPDRLLISFHGLPRYTLERGDPYHCECQKTARMLAEALGLAEHQWLLGFQSRFGRTAWLQPYTSVLLRQLGSAGTARVDVVCPGFVSDCLETLEEIGIEGKAQFLQSGGKDLRLIACLNDSDAWIHALSDIALSNLGDWAPRPFDRDAAQIAANQSKLQAKTKGAVDAA